MNGGPDSKPVTPDDGEEAARQINLPDTVGLDKRRLA